MDQALIDELWKRTRRKIHENKTGIWADVNSHLIYKISQFKPVGFSLSSFMSEDEVIFLSFHDDEGNNLAHYHDFFEINYVIKGNPVGVIDGQEIHYKEKGLSIMNPNAVHYYKDYKDNRDLILNIVIPYRVFEKEIYHPLLNDQILNAFFIRYRVENSKNPSFIYIDQVELHVQNIIEMLVNEYLYKRNYSLVAIESLLTLLFSFILRNSQNDKSGKDNPASEIIEYIYQNYQTCSLKKVAKAFNYHPKYLSSIIHNQTGQSYRNLITKIRLQNAQHYLLYTELTIEAIASKVGYKEKSSFYGSFKKQFKMSPNNFRTAHTFR